jgi:hypothetical protein
MRVISLLCVVSASQAVRDGPSKSAWGKLIEIPGANSPEFGKDRANLDRTPAKAEEAPAGGGVNCVDAGSFPGTMSQPYLFISK